MRLIAIVIAEIVSILTLMLIAGHGTWSGRDLISFGDTHGLNTGDVPVLVLWAAAMACCVSLWRRGVP